MYHQQGTCLELKRIVGIDDVVKSTGISRSTIWREVKKGRFPKPMQLSAGRVGWFEDEVDAYFEARRVA